MDGYCIHRALHAAAKQASDAMAEKQDEAIMDLLAKGISLDRIRLEHHPDCRTRVMVDGWPFVEIRLNLVTGKIERENRPEI
jgi:hypothetical protein